jgi:glycosyltransferase involved in cell wall biosynthesis
MFLNDPLVSVVMPVYNSDEYLAEAIESILSQTFRDFEFIIICDEPSQKARDIIDNYQKNDNRIIVFYQKKEGLVAALNKGCSTAKGKYIARMDADDICYPKRFEFQVRFLEEHENIGVLGTWREFIDQKNSITGHDCSTGNSNILKWHILFGSGFSQSHGIAHPTVMMRRQLIKKVNGYSTKYSHNEDFDLWIRLINWTDFSNIPEILLKYRFNKNRVSLKFEEDQEQNSLKIFQAVLVNYLDKEFDIETTRKIIRMRNIQTETDVRIVFQYLEQIFTVFINHLNPTPEEIHQIKRDLHCRLLVLSLISLKVSRKLSIRLIVQAFFMNPLNTVSFYGKLVKNIINVSI